eukprot:scaffold87069_cov21-Tisochrysis_lutea.AAC.1
MSESCVASAEARTCTNVCTSKSRLLQIGSNPWPAISLALCTTHMMAVSQGSNPVQPANATLEGPSGGTDSQKTMVEMNGSLYMGDEGAGGEGNAFQASSRWVWAVRAGRAWTCAYTHESRGGGVSESTEATETLPNLIKGAVHSQLHVLLWGIGANLPAHASNSPEDILNHPN